MDTCPYKEDHTLQTFILIISALIFGFSTGYRLKRTKANSNLVKALNEINSLQQTIKEKDKKERLSQYASNPNIKYHQDYFEQKIVEYSSHDDEDYLKCSMLLTLLETLPFSSDYIMTFNYVTEITQAYSEALMFAQKKNANIKVKTKSGILQDFNINKVIETAKTLLEELSIDCYDITVEDTIKSLSFVLSMEV